MAPRFAYSPRSGSDAGSAAQLGSKAARLVEISGILPVPRFYVITQDALEQTILAAALRERIDDQLEQLLGRTDASVVEITRAIQEWLLAVDIPAWVQDELRQAHSAVFAEDALVAVRSSVIGEDASRFSFAGMHDSVLGVSWRNGYCAAVRRVWASAYSERALHYRRQNHLPLSPLRVAVIVQQLIDARSSGVMFTRHPGADGEGCMLIHSTSGFSIDLLGGGAAPDTFVVDRITLHQVADPAVKTHHHVLDQREGRIVRREIAGDQRTACSLAACQVQNLARAGLALERCLHGPQDVEFCYDEEGRLFIVQSRPALPSPTLGGGEGNHLVWDNSNIVESYAGVTTPMTFSFVRRVYSIVYYCFGEVMGVSATTLRQHRRTYEQMLGLIRGRIYYNLFSWYRSLRLLPGFHYNRKFMESMMGVKERLHHADAPEVISWSRRWFIEFPALVRMLSRMAWKLLRIQHEVSRFEANFAKHYATWAELDFRGQSPHHMRGIYQEMEDALLWNWKAPIINDFYVMFFFGLLKELCRHWCDDDSGTLQNELIRGEGGMESAAPARMMLQLASLAQADPLLRQMILTESLPGLPDRIARDERFGDFSQRMSDYLDLYGFRCTDELKLEQPSLKERPEQVYQALKNYLQLDNPDAVDRVAIEQRETRARREAEQQALQALAGKSWSLLRKVVLLWVLKHARAGVKNRENMRFARTRIFGLIREMLRAMGAHLAAEGILDEEEDVFFLTMDEMWDFVAGTAVTTDLRQLTRLRRREFAEYRDTLPAPADRFETEGMVYHRNSFQKVRCDGPRAAERLLRGAGCCAGIVTGTAQVMTNPLEGALQPGQVLVTRQLDPGWVPVFPVVSGILAERGSLLSHSAVVAREMGIPTIVGITGLMSRLATGANVRMDGRRGTVEILTESSGTASSGVR